MQCPGCATPVDVDQRLAHLVVCSSCRSAFVLDGDAASIHGEMAVLADPSGPLSVGNSGVLHGKSFRVLGRVRYGYGAGFWDEWYLADDAGETFWIGEDEREFTVSIPSEVADPPAWEDCEPGASIKVGGHTWHVDERDTARCEGGEGQLPFVVEPGEQVRFVDLTRVDGFGTLEWTDEGVRFFSGRHIPLSALQMDYAAVDTGALEGERAAGADGRRRVMKKSGREVALNCESCGAPPDQAPPAGAESVACEFCGHDIDLRLDRIECRDCGAGMAVHSVEASSVVCVTCGAQHELAGDGARLLGKLSQDAPALPLRIGMKGRFRGRDWRIVGYIRSFERDEGRNYYCDSFCAFNEEEGYAWFELENGHASFNHPITSRPSGLNPRSAGRKQTFSFNGTRWKVFERGILTTEFVAGELPWVAAVGDKVGYMDAIAPPFMLCAEWSETEMEWSRSEWIPPEEMCTAFGLKAGAIDGHGVAPHQPYPHKQSDGLLLKIGGAVLTLNLCFIMWALIAGSGHELARFTLAPADYAEEYLTPEFVVEDAPTLCRATFKAPVDNSWVYLDCALIDEHQRAIMEFSAECSYYHGVEGGESWSEGSKTDHVDFRVRSPGTYRLLVKGQAGIGAAEGGWAGPDISVVVKDGVRQARYSVGVMVIAGLVLLIVAIRKGSFETKRWGDDD